MKIKLVGRPGNIAIRFDEKSFFKTILGFNHGWDFKRYNEYISQKIVNLNTATKKHLKTDVIDVADGLWQPIFFSFVLDKLSGYKVFCEPETIHYKKIDRSALKTITFFKEKNDHEEVIFNGKTLTVTLKRSKSGISNEFSKLWN